MRAPDESAAARLRLGPVAVAASSSAHQPAGLAAPVPGDRRRALWPRDTRLDEQLQSAVGHQRDPGLVPGGWQRAPGAGRADGGDVRPAGGRDAAGAPRFDQPVAPGAYLWWYLDALSDNFAGGERFGLTLIAFVGSVFSPYYALARSRGDAFAQAENFCCINVALYGPGARRWTMTERGARHVRRSANEFVVGPSALRWDGSALRFDLHEVGMPWPQRVDGTVTVHPHGLSRFVAPLDEAGAHRWGPIAPCARVEVDLQRPGLRWSGEGYLDSNEGDEPIDRPFRLWDWSRAALADGSTAVIYDVRNKQGPDRVITQHFQRDGSSQAFSAPPRQSLPRTGWRIERAMRSERSDSSEHGGSSQSSESAAPPRVLQTLEDTPFYQRSLVESQLFGQRVLSVHETLDVPRLVSPLVRLMLPFRMPRRGGLTPSPAGRERAGVRVGIWRECPDAPHPNPLPQVGEGAIPDTRSVQAIRRRAARLEGIGADHIAFALGLAAALGTAPRTLDRIACFALHGTVALDLLRQVAQAQHALPLPRRPVINGLPALGWQCLPQQQCQARGQHDGGGDGAQDFQHAATLARWRRICSPCVAEAKTPASLVGARGSVLQRAYGLWAELHHCARS